MKLKNIIINILLLGFCFLSLTCKSLTGPGDNAQPGSRNYVWTIDTLHFSGSGHLESIWGSSSTDIWTGGNEDLFHFDGIHWTSWKEYIGSNVNTLYGFSTSDVWMGGDDGDIWHFDGNHWNENFVYRPDGFTNVTIQKIAGTKSNDIYAVGVIWYSDTTHRGFILHYDGMTWKEVFKANFYSSFAGVLGENGIVYIFNWLINSTTSDLISFYQFDGMYIKDIYSSTVANKGWAFMDNIGQKVYFILSREIYRYEYTTVPLATGEYFPVGNFVKQFSIGNIANDYRISGRNEKDVFVLMQDKVAHWNGTDLQDLVIFSNNSTYATWPPSIYDKDVFFCSYDAINNLNLVFHGKLTE